jgi:hypothetical protein
VESAAEPDPEPGSGLVNYLGNGKRLELRIGNTAPDPAPMEGSFCCTKYLTLYSTPPCFSPVWPRSEVVLV